MAAKQPIPTFILSTEGLKPTAYKVYSLSEAVAHEPRGVYTLARTFHGDQALLFDAHLDRLEESARLSKIDLHLNRAQLRGALRDLLHQAGYSDTKFRITVAADDPKCLYLALEPFQMVPEAIQREGAHVSTLPIVRENPAVKTTDWMTTRKPAQKQLPAGVYEGIMISQEGILLEGLSSNFYAVLDGVLRTTGEGVLAGITRKAICTIAPAILPVEMTGIAETDIPHVSEAMLTSSGRGVVPITRINGQPVGNGAVGPVVSELRRRYDAWTEAHIEAI